MSKTPGQRRLENAYANSNTDDQPKTETYWLDTILLSMPQSQQDATAELFNKVNPLLGEVDLSFRTFVASYSGSTPRGITDSKADHTNNVITLGHETDHIVSTCSATDHLMLQALALYVSSWTTGKLLQFGLSTLPIEAITTWSAFTGCGSNPLVSLRSLKDRDDLTLQLVKDAWSRSLTLKPEDCWAITRRYVLDNLGSFEALEATLDAERHMELAAALDTSFENDYNTAGLRETCLRTLRSAHPEYESFPDSWIIEIASPSVS